MPTPPQNEAGRVTLPPVWLPNGGGHIPEETAAADPLLEPPGVCFRFHGFLVGAGSRHANSVVSVLPKIIAPAFLSVETISESSVGMLSLYLGVPIVVAMPFVL